MDCSSFLDAYSDFRDGLITDPGVLRQLRRHLGDCLACARYDASVRHGVRAVGEVDPSPDFRERLRERIAATAGRPMEPVGPGATGIAAGLMLAAAVALLLYERTSRPDELPAAVAASTVPAPGDAVAALVMPDSSLPRAMPARAMPLVVVNPGVPFVTFTEASVSPYHTAGGPEFHRQSHIPIDSWANLPR